jgi:hypothetical protein
MLQDRSDVESDTGPLWLVIVPLCLGLILRDVTNDFYNTKRVYQNY